jgi:hypothetical protein
VQPASGLWVRGILTDVYGFGPDIVTWVTFENSYLAAIDNGGTS